MKKFFHLRFVDGLSPGDDKVERPAQLEAYITEGDDPAAVAKIFIDKAIHYMQTGEKI